jgi:glycosyltransferase involved in cell wall biosynthesis
MHLLINASDLGRRRGGNESYLIGLLTGLAAVARDTNLRVSALVSSEGALLLAAEPRVGRISIRNMGAYRRVPFLVWQQTALVRRLQPDWFVSTFFLPPLTPSRAAVLIHDLSFRSHPEYFPLPIAAYMRLLTGLAMRRADVVVALSEFTRSEIWHFYPHARGRSAVVYPGVGEEFTPDGDAQADEGVLDALGVRQPYLLAVGNIHPRKNLERLLVAWLSLREAGRPVPAMVWAGLSHWGSRELLERACVAGVHLLGYVEPAHLPALYRRAQALAYPSLYEGLGLPPLEAMACGTPVLVAGSTSLPEAVGDAAVTVDPHDAGALAEGLAMVLFDDLERRELRSRGLARASRFGWRHTAEELVRALK